MELYYQNIFDFFEDQQIFTNLVLHLEMLKHKEKIHQFNSLTQNHELTLDDFSNKNENFQNVLKLISIQRELIEQKLKETQKRKINLKITEFEKRFDLCDTETALILFCITVQKNPGHLRVIRALTENSANSYATVDLLKSIIFHSLEPGNAGFNYLSGEDRLLKYRLLETVNSRNDNSHAVFGSDQIKVPDRILNFIFEKDFISYEISGLINGYPGAHSFEEILVNEDVFTSVKNLLNHKKHETEKNSGNFIFYFKGAQGSGKKSTALKICRELKIPLLSINFKEIIYSGYSIKKIMELLLRECILTKCAIYFSGIEYLYKENISVHHLMEFKSELHQNKYMIFIGSREKIELKREFPEKDFFQWIFYNPGYEKRKKFWKYFIKNYKINPEVDISHVANKYQLNGGQIQNAVKEAHKLSLISESSEIKIEPDNLITSCKAQSHHKLNELAVKITHFQSWSELVLPENETKQLHEIINYFNNKHIVYEKWGYGKKSPLGKGLNVLFFGQSGTGKTMAAGVIARELELDLYKIDLSSIVSKYIGETEKNLNKIFTEAQSSNAVLFFDEADALFGARSDVKDAHDRYANIEVGYLLQKMDEYTGISILATNMKDNIDDAFIRRMHAIVEFYYPDEEHRYKIWKKSFTKETPMSDDVDLSFMAKQFHLSGGNIRNIILFAGFYAAGNGGMVTMEHLIYSTKREFEKMGRSATRQEFGEYYELVKE